MNFQFVKFEGLSYIKVTIRTYNVKQGISVQLSEKRGCKESEGNSELEG